MFRRVVTIEGKEYISITEACKAYGIPRSTVNYRMSTMCMSVAEAITTPLKYISNITINGESFKTLTEVSEKYNIDYYTLYYRVKIAKWSIDEAVIVPVMKYIRKFTIKKIIINGKEYESIKLFSKHIKVKYSTVSDRIYAKLHLVRYNNAITKAEYSGDLRKKPIAGFDSIKEAAAASGLSEWTISSRIKRGWSEYDAVHTPRYKNLEIKY